MARRGFFAELNHQSRVAARGRERAEREAARRHLAAARNAEQAQRLYERAQAQLAKAAEADRKRLEKEARQAHTAAREAEVSEKNDQLAQLYDEIDSLLAATLDVDDYVDLNSLRAKVTHPPFDRGDLETPVPKPDWIPDPHEPVLQQIEAPSGLSKLFGKKKYEEAVAAAQRSHEQALSEWRVACSDVRKRRQKVMESRDAKEATRLEMLSAARNEYTKECALREAKAAEQNKKLGALITNLGYGVADAIEEYVSIVLSNSVYPPHFQVSHEFEFDSSTAELRLQVVLPAPSDIPTIKSYRYQKSTDDISSAVLSQKECRDRYAGAVHQVALRSFHEIFESDRRGLIKTISLEVGTKTIDPATGLPTSVPFVIAAAERESFRSFDLSAVVPALTLGRLGAAVSKNPFGLVPAERAGVRRS